MDLPSGRIALRSVVRGRDGHRGDDRGTGLRGHREASVHLVEVQVLRGAQTVDDLRSSLAARVVAGARNDGVVLAEHVAREGRGEQQEVEVTVRGVVTHRLLTSELDRGQATVGIAHGHEGVVAPTAGGGRLEAADDRRVAAGDRGELTLHAGGAVDTVTVGETRVDVVVARREGAGVLVPLAVADPTHLEVDIEFTHAAIAVAGAVHRGLRIFTDTVDRR